MKVALTGASPTIPFTTATGDFKLIMKRLMGSDKTKLLDAAMENSFTALQEACGRLIEDWINVCGEDGTPIQFKFKNKDDQWEYRFDAFMGAIDLKLQLAVLAGIMGFCGVPKKAIEELIGKIEKEAVANLDPTLPPAANTAGDASVS